jgi:hypothetical protein
MWGLRLSWLLTIYEILGGISHSREIGKRRGIMASINKEWLVDRVYEMCIDHDKRETSAFALTIEILGMHVGPNDESMMDILLAYEPEISLTDQILNVRSE